MRRKLAIGLVAGALALPVWGAGLEPLGEWTSGREPIQVDARTLEARAGEGLIVFEGDVLARQGDVTLHSDRLTVRIDEASRQIRSVLAEGAVRVERGPLVAVGETADYDAARGIVVLSGDAKVWRDRDVVAGDRITLYLAEDRSVVEGAKAILYPPGSTTPLQP